MIIKDWLNSHLIWNWKKCFHLHSIKGLSVGVILSALATALALVYGSADASEHALVPSWVTYLIFFLIFAGSFIGRLWHQNQKGDTDDDA